MHKILYRAINAGLLLFAGLGAAAGAYLAGTIACELWPVSAHVIGIVVLGLCGWLAIGLPCLYAAGKASRRVALQWGMYWCPACGVLREKGDEHLCPARHETDTLQDGHDATGIPGIRWEP